MGCIVMIRSFTAEVAEVERRLCYLRIREHQLNELEQHEGTKKSM